MAPQSHDNGPEFFTGPQSAENIRRKLIDAPFEAAQQKALGALLEIGAVFSKIPEAFIESQRRELERVKTTGKEDDPRIEVLQTSIEHTEGLQTTVQRGRIRAERALLAAVDREYVFHGFVSDADLLPLHGLTLRLTINRSAAAAPSLVATTDEEGYFRIPLGPRDDHSEISQRIMKMFSGASDRKSAAESSAEPPAADHVEILKGSRVLLRDDATVPRNEGSVYREYFIPKESRSG